MPRGQGLARRVRPEGQRGCARCGARRRRRPLRHSSPIRRQLAHFAARAPRNSPPKRTRRRPKPARCAAAAGRARAHPRPCTKKNPSQSKSSQSHPACSRGPPGTASFASPGRSAPGPNGLQRAPRAGRARRFALAAHRDLPGCTPPNQNQPNLSQARKKKALPRSKFESVGWRARARAPRAASPSACAFSVMCFDV